MPGSVAICARMPASWVDPTLITSTPQAIPAATSQIRIMYAVPRPACVKPHRFVQTAKREFKATHRTPVRGSAAVQRLKALTSGAGGTEGREPGTRAHGQALWRQIKGLVENNRRDHRARNSLSRHMAKTMTPMPGSLRLRRLGGGARGGHDRHPRGAWVASARGGRKVMKKGNRDCQRQA